MWETTDERIEKINPKFDLAPVQYDLEEMGLRGFLHQFVTYKGKAAIIDAHKLFCHKRSIFSYENEIRVIDVESINSTTEKCSFHIASLPDFIEGVMVHPLAEDEYVKLVEEICNHFNIAFLGKSQIYEMKEIY